ncbi:hypothetical protein BDR03DRAFT_957332 [Suillus americanus]|nr:hypothetical protein BDR03DRAFT_957332 [Suillus americanus]
MSNFGSLERSYRRFDTCGPRFIYSGDMHRQLSRSMALNRKLPPAINRALFSYLFPDKLGRPPISY